MQKDLCHNGDNDTEDGQLENRMSQSGMYLPCYKYDNIVASLSSRAATRELAVDVLNVLNKFLKFLRRLSFMLVIG